jgi:hypothetical protein
MRKADTKAADNDLSRQLTRQAADKALKSGGITPAQFAQLTAPKVTRAELALANELNAREHGKADLNVDVVQLAERVQTQFHLQNPRDLSVMWFQLRLLLSSLSPRSILDRTFG